MQPSVVDGLPVIYLINPTSLAKPLKLDQLKADIHSFTADIIIVCESWLKRKHDSALFNIANYCLYRQDRTGRVGGGICVYVNEKFNSCLYKFESGNRLVSPHIELMWLNITLVKA